MRKIFLTEVIKYALIIGFCVVSLVWAALSRSTMSNLYNTLDGYLKSSMIKVEHDINHYNAMLEEYKISSVTKASSIAIILASNPTILKNQYQLDYLRLNFSLDEILIIDDKGNIDAVSSENKESHRTCSHIQEFLASDDESNFKKYQEPSYCDKNGEVFQYSAVSRIDKKGLVIVGKSESSIRKILNLASIQDTSDMYPIYEHGFISVVNKQSGIIESYKNNAYTGRHISELNLDLEYLVSLNDVTNVRIDGKEAFLLVRDGGAYYFLAFAYKKDVYFSMYVYVFIILASVLLMVVFMHLFMLQIVKQHIIDGIDYIISCLDSITKDNLNTRVELNTCEEFTILSNSINSMVTRLHRLLITEKILAIENQNIANAKGDFLAMMSHEIRTPLNIIIGMAQSGLSNENDTNKMKEAFTDINAASTHLLSLLNDILDMSKIDAGKLELNPEAFSLEEDINHLKLILTPKAQEVEINLSINTEGIDKLAIIGDKIKLNQVLINLLSNSFKFTEKFKKVSLFVSVLENNEDDVLIRFLVEDEGIGMDEEKLKVVFNPFEQVDVSITRSFGGIGLGLTISKNIVELMGGRINAESELGKGSKFWFDISFKKTEIYEVNDEEVTLIDNSLEGYRALVVDDEPLNRKVIGIFLGKTGIKIEEAGSGKEAVDLFKEKPAGYFDMIFMDIHMPEMNGFQATDAIRKSDRLDSLTIPIIAVTADAFKENEEKVLNSGMNAFVSKPVSVPKLGSAIKSVMEHRTSFNEQMMIWTKIKKLY